MTEEETSIARQIVSEWFWQPAEGHNYRYRGALRTMTRFFESAPMEPDVMKLVIEYLRDEVIEGGISLMNRSVDLGTGWKAMDAWFRTDETEKWAGTESRKVRVYQILMQQPADGDAADGPYVLDKGCQYRVTHTYYWNVAALPESPASSSGVSYSLEGVLRDRETGLYNCVITKRERVQQDVAEYLSEATQFQETREELHLGVKEGASAGKSAGVSAGKTVERHVTKNEDCTHDVRNVTRKDLPVSNAVVTTEETAFETRTTSESRNQSRAANAPAKPGESVRNEKTPTKLFNQVKTVTVEKPVKGAAVEFRKTLHGTVRSVTDRNQAAPVTDANLKIGERRSSRMTDGAHYDNTSEQLTTEPAGDVAATGRKTVFEESASKRENVAAGGTLPKREADEAGDGKTHSVEVVLHDDGSADVTKTDTAEKPVKGAVVEFRRTLRGTVQSVTDRNQPEPVTPDGIQIGESRSSRMTDGGRYDNTHSVTTVDEPVKISASCAMSAASHTDAETRVVPAESADAEPRCLEVPHINTITEKLVRWNDDGRTADVTMQTRRLKEQSGNSVSSSGDNEVKVEIKRVDNATEKIELPECGVNKRVEVNNVPNGAGGYNTVESTTTYRPSDSKEIIQQIDDTTEQVLRFLRNRENHEDLLPSEDSVGRVNLSLSRNDHSSWDGGYVITRPIAVGGYGIRVIEEAKDETFAVGLRYGKWVWSNNLNEEGFITRAWEYRRFCTMRVRYTGMTSDAANQLKAELDRRFTRTVYGSLWQSSGSPGYFTPAIIGRMRMAKVVKYHMIGNLWGVHLNVNESTTRLSTNRVTESSMFAEERQWSYDIPAGGKNVG